MTRKEYIESELNKWKMNYEVNFNEEFDLRLMFDLQYQAMISPRDHVKTIGDIVHTINQIKRNLRFKPFSKVDGETWIIDTHQHKEVDGGYVKLTLTKFLSDSDRVKVVGNLNRSKIGNLKDLADLLFGKVRLEKPSRVLINQVGVGMGIYDHFREFISKSMEIKIEENGELKYKN